MRWLGALVLCATFLCACGEDAASGDGGGPITVFAASSLADAFPRIDDSPRYQFAGSDELALQIREGAAADVFAAASPKYPDELEAEGLASDPVVFATNSLVLVVPADNPAGIEGVDDLDVAGVKLVVAAQGVPVGDYTRTALDNMGASDVLDQVVSEEQDTRAVLSKVALGEADAGFVYATDVAAGGDDVKAIRLPEEAQPEVAYVIALVSGSQSQEEASAFIDLVLSDEGQAVLQDAGFGSP